MISTSGEVKLTLEENSRLQDSLAKFSEPQNKIIQVRDESNIFFFSVAAVKDFFLVIFFLFSETLGTLFFFVRI